MTRARATARPMPVSDDRETQGEHREADIVAAGKPGFERQHGDEMGSPDSRTAGHGRDAEPDGAELLRGFARVMQQLDRRDRRQGADGRREGDQPQVV